MNKILEYEKMIQTEENPTCQLGIFPMHLTHAYRLLYTQKLI